MNVDECCKCALKTIFIACKKVHARKKFPQSRSLICKFHSSYGIFFCVSWVAVDFAMTQLCPNCYLAPLDFSVSSNPAGVLMEWRFRKREKYAC